MGALILCDALWGDSGKGKISAYLCRKHDAKYCIRAGTGTNAGHSVYEGNKLFKLRQLPCGFLNDKTVVMVGSGVAVDPQVFLDEVKEYGLRSRAKVDFRCPIITEEYRLAESRDSSLSEIGSTKSGTGYTLAQFRLRKAKQARDIPELKDYLADVAEEANNACEAGEKVIVECSQGTMLSLALSPDYPYVTSDNCTAIAAADDAGLNWRAIEDVFMVVKALPTRVGKGPLPYEMSVQEIEKRRLAEYGVVTGRPRRKASQIDMRILKYVSMLNAPSKIALTFCDHYDPDITGANSKTQLTPKILKLIREIEETTRAKVVIAETGKDLNNIIDLSESSDRIPRALV